MCVRSRLSKISSRSAKNLYSDGAEMPARAVIARVVAASTPSCRDQLGRGREDPRDRLSAAGLDRLAALLEGVGHAADPLIHARRP